MTRKERLLCAINGGQPDRVPCTPDISNMIPCRLTGRPFWDIYLHNKPSLYQAYAQAVDHFGIDGWYCTSVRFIHQNRNQFTPEITMQTDQRLRVRTTITTPLGKMFETMAYYRDNPPTPTEKMVKDLAEDFPKIRTLYTDIVRYEAPNYESQKALCGDTGIFCLDLGVPGMHTWNNFFHGNLQAAVYAHADYPHLFEEWAALEDKEALQRTAIYLSLKPDVLMIGASGTLTLSTPDMVRQYTLPTIKKITRMAKEAGIPTMMHACGRSRALVQMLYDETDLCCINPLEVAPMGDISLKEAKVHFGDKLCLMGNLNTTSVMLMGTPADVAQAARQAIDDAGPGGGFILSTGDQCGRDTPDENILKLVEVAQTYGRY